MNQQLRETTDQLMAKAEELLAVSPIAPLQNTITDLEAKQAF